MKFFSFTDKTTSLVCLIPTAIIMFSAIYGFIAWTAVISTTDSGFLLSYQWVGIDQYLKLINSSRWWVSCLNLAIYSFLFVSISLCIGIFLAILIDQQIKFESLYRTIFLYPMAISFVVTGTAWKWILNPQYGIESVFHNLGFTSFQFDWLVDPQMAIYTVVIAAVWQSSGFIMALFLAGLRSIDKSIIEAAQIDGASPTTIYLRVILPCLRPIFMSSAIILIHIAIKSFDLVAVLTQGGPGYASDLPALFMYTHAFTRNQMGLGAASAIMMLVAVSLIIVPYLYYEMKKDT